MTTLTIVLNIKINTYLLVIMPRLMMMNDKRNDNDSNS